MNGENVTAETPSTYIATAREIEKGDSKDLKPCNVSFLSTFTIEILRPYLMVENAKRGFKLNPYFAPFNQLEQQLFDSESPVFQSKPDVIVLGTRLEELAPDLIHRFVSLSPKKIDEELSEVTNRIENLIKKARESTPVPILVFNFSAPSVLSAGLSDPSLKNSQVGTIEKLNQKLAEVCSKFSAVHIFDYSRCLQEMGLRSQDPKLWYMGRIPLGVEGQIHLGKKLARYFRALLTVPSKCLVVDLDDTLWGGVLGEEGIDGIGLGEEYPGRVFKDFQRRLLSLRDRGILLAVASKNNEEDALEVFEKHPECLLKKEDFSAMEINWQDKATSLKSIAKKLNIGTDALVFFDDNPVEREWIRSQLPEVSVIEVPKNPLGYAGALEESGAFDQLAILDEDRQRVVRYQKEKERQDFKKKAANLDDFLKQLNTKATIGYVNESTLPRVTQLLGKTNQFNLTTRRHATSQIQSFLSNGGIALWIRVEDRFGSYGLVGTAIAVPEDKDSWKIDSFLLSCRVLGRNVENALLGALSRSVKENGGKKLIGEYIPTPKNTPAATFYEKAGFLNHGKEENHWARDVSKTDFPFPKHIKVTIENDSGNTN